MPPWISVGTEPRADAIMLRAAYYEMLREYGTQAWWPAVERFEIMVGAILVQQTTWTSAARAIASLRQAGLLSSDTLAMARLKSIEARIRPAGFYRTKARRLRMLARFVNRAGGEESLSTLSSTCLRERLLALEGVGEETADAILLYAFERAAVVIDAYTRRWYQRMRGNVQTDEQLRSRISAEIDAVQDLNEFHALIVEHGKRYCRKQPRCDDCFLRISCRHGAAGGGAGPDHEFG